MAKSRTPAVAYLRTSLAAIVGADKDSDKSQRAAIHGYAKRAGFEVVGEYYDPGVSGADPIEGRRGFAELLDRVQNNACLRVANRGKANYELRRFPTTTRGLIELGDWLEQGGCTHVAMEATGVHWKPVWHILEGWFHQILANAAHIKAVPGRKSDTHDATWISDLLAHGLIRPSFVPPQPIQKCAI